MTEFTVGDKVTCPVWGRGVVKSIEQGFIFVSYDRVIMEPIRYDLDGSRNCGWQIEVKLAKGHGSFKLEFIEDEKEVLKHQYLYKFSEDGEYTITRFKTEEEWEAIVAVSAKSLKWKKIENGTN
jgi:hypothetical protein